MKLIILPIKWHGVKTPYVDSMLGNTLRVWTPDFWRPIFKGPVPLSSMATSWFWWIIFGFPWCFVKFFWVILYIPMKVFYLIVVNFGAILWVCFYILTIPFRVVWNTAGLAVRIPWWLVARTPAFRSRFPNAVATPLSGWITAWNMLTWPYRRLFGTPKNVLNITQLPSTVGYESSLAEMAPILEPATKILPVLETPESIPPPTCSACCNTTCCNNFAMRLRHARQFMGTTNSYVPQNFHSYANVQN